MRISANFIGAVAIEQCLLTNFFEVFDDAPVSYTDANSNWLKPSAYAQNERKNKLNFEHELSLVNLLAN